MKINLPFLIFFFVTIISFNLLAKPVLAVQQGVGNTTATNPVNKGKGSERWEQRKTEVRQQIINKIKEHSKILVDRYNAAIVRLEKIVAKIEIKISEDKNKGINTSKIESDLTSAKAKLASAKVSIDTAKTQIDAITPEGQENQIANTLKQVRDILKAQKQNLIEIRQSLKTVVSDLKALEISPDQQNGGD